MTSLAFPEFSAVPPDQRASGEAPLRYEDLAQNGVLKVAAMPQALGHLFFRTLWSEHAINRACRAQGVLPILSRLTLAAQDGPISVHHPLQAEGQFSMGSVHDASGAIERLVLNMDARLAAPCGRTHDPQPAREGELLHVGKVHAEHVFTRPFGRPEQRKVTDISLDGVSAVPDVPLVHARAPELLQMDEAAEWVDEDYALDPVSHSFGLVHTDSNQHVNSLVYPTWFEEALLRRMVALGADTRRSLLGFIDLGFRKPCFAGDRVQLWVRCFRREERWGAVAYLAPEGVASERAHVTCRMWMR